MRAILTVVALIVATRVLGQDVNRAYGRFEGGQFWRHNGESGGSAGPGAGIRLGRPWKALLLETGGGFAVDEAVHIQADVAVIVPACASCRARPYVGVQTGLICDHEYCAGPWIGALAGVDLRLTGKLGAYVVGRYGRHGGAQGPAMIGGGLVTYGW